MPTEGEEGRLGSQRRFTFEQRPLRSEGAAIQMGQTLPGSRNGLCSACKR